MPCPNVRCGIALDETGLQSLASGQSQILFQCLAVGRGKVGQLGFAQLQRGVAALGDFKRVLEGLRNIGKSSTHFFLGHEVLLLGESALTSAAAQGFAFGNANAGLMGAEIVGLDKLHRMGGDQAHAVDRCQMNRLAKVVLFARQSGALHFNVKPIAKCRHVSLNCQIGSRRARGLDGGA